MKNREQEGENQEKGEKRKKEEKSGRFFHVALLTDRAGYATENPVSTYYPIGLENTIGSVNIM